MTKILAIDDIDDNLISLKAIIQDTFPDSVVLTANNGQDGIALAVENNPDVILLDIIMPGMDGFEVCKYLKQDERVCDIPVVFLTALRGDKINRIKALDAGAEGFLSKPIDEVELKAQINVMLKISESNRLKKNENERLQKLVEIRTKEIKESEKRFRHISSSISDVSYSCKTDHSGKSYLDWLYGPVEKLTGYSSDELINLECWGNLVVEEDFPIFKRHILGALPGKSEICELRIKKKNGNIVWVQASAECVINDDFSASLYGGLTDITGRKEAESLLKESEERFKLVFKAANVAQSITLLTGEVNANQVFCNMFGYTEAELNGKKWQELTSPDEVETDQKIIDLILSGERSSARRIKRYIHKNGSILWGDVSFALIRDYSGKPLHFITTIVDVTERKQAEDALRQNNNRLGLAMEVANLTWWEMDIETGNVVFEKRKAEMLGYAPEKFEHYTHFMELVHPEDYEPTMNAMRNHLSGATDKYEIEYRIKTASGDYKWFYDIGSIVNRDDHGKPLTVAGLVLNISERKRSELDLKEINARLGLVLENTPIAIWDWNLEADTWIATSKYYTMLGYEAESVFSDRETWIKRIHPDERELVLSKIKNVLLHVDDDYSYDARMLHADGSYRWQTVIGHVVSRDEKGKATRMLGVRVDIDERKRAEEGLKESVLLFQGLFNASPDAILLIDPHHPTISWPIVDCNQACCDMNGYTREEMIGKSIDIINVQNGTSMERKAYLDELKQAGVLHTEAFHHHKNGHIFPVEISTSIINIGGKEMILGIDRDITERKKMENELIEAKEKAEESDRLKSAFLANMSHEIRTPLNSIIGFSELMTDSGFDQDQRTEFAQIINENGNSLLSILSDIMDISKIEAGQVQVKKSTIVVNNLVAEIMREFSFKAKTKGIELKLAEVSSPDRIMIESDETKIRQILANLVGNAMKFTNDGYVEIGCKLINKNVIFHVRDTGIGIPEKYHNQLFKRFSQIESFNSRKYGGNGLGLAISKSLVELLGGRIWMESQEGIGSVFYFNIPMET